MIAKIRQIEVSFSYTKVFVLLERKFHMAKNSLHADNFRQFDDFFSTIIR